MTFPRLEESGKAASRPDRRESERAECNKRNVTRRYKIIFFFFRPFGRVSSIVETDRFRRQSLRIIMSIL